MTPEEAHRLWAAGELALVDVREQDEHEKSWIDGVPLIPMSEIADRIEEVPADGPLAVICRSGGRSAQVADFLTAQGEYGAVANVDGGIIAWAQAGLAYGGDEPD